VCRDDGACLDGSQCIRGCCAPLELVGCRIELPAPIAWRGLRSWELAPESRPILDRVAEALLRFEDELVAIDVQDASTGAGKYSRVATRKRANTIRDYLISRGLPRERLVARGWDAERPVGTNKTGEGRAKSRRVEIVLSTSPECARLLGPPCGPIEQAY
jgi:hypothetical protein